MVCLCWLVPFDTLRSGGNSNVAGLVTIFTEVWLKSAVGFLTLFTTGWRRDSWVGRCPLLAMVGRRGEVHEDHLENDKKLVDVYY